MAGEESRNKRFNDSLWEVYRPKNQPVKTPPNASMDSDENFAG